MRIQEEFLILDYRNVKELGNYTVTGYKRSDVIKALKDSLKNGLIENACNWSAELIISGRIKDVFGLLLLYGSKNINISNPNLPFYLWNKFKYIKNNFDLDSKDSLNLRNNQEMRNIFCELTTIMCLSKKNEINNLITIKQNEYDISFLKDKLSATNFDLINSVLEGGDPSEMTMIANELAYNLNINNFEKSMYWLSWILEWDKINIQKNGGYRCANRYKYIKNDKYATDVIWLICDILLHIACNYRSYTTKINAISLVNLFRQDYTISNKTKKISHIIHIVHLITKQINFSESVYQSYPIIVQACSNINSIYQSLRNKSNVCKEEFLKKETIVRNNNFKQEKKKENPVKKKKKKGDLSNNSLSKMQLMKEIDNLTLSRQDPTLYHQTVQQDKKNLEQDVPKNIIVNQIDEIDNYLFKND